MSERIERIRRELATAEERPDRDDCDFLLSELDRALKVVAAAKGVSENWDGGWDGVYDLIDAVKDYDAPR